MIGQAENGVHKVPVVSSTESPRQTPLSGICSVTGMGDGPNKVSDATPIKKVEL